MSKGGIHKTIEAPTYSEVDDDSIYTFITRYKNYLLHEQLSPEQCQYNKKEQTMFILNALSFDKRFWDGLQYVEASLQSFQRDSRVTSSTTFPINLEIDKIVVTIDERSDDYIVGTKTQSPTIINPYVKSSICTLGHTTGA